MAKNKPTDQAEPKPKRAPKPKPAPGPWPFPYWLRLCLSVWLAWHMFVVFMAPLSLQPKTSLLTETIAQSKLIRWYSDPLYLNGGYSFFSPDPPPGGRVYRYTVYGEGNQPIAEGEFPNRANPNHATQWPRLWYHRHMMLVDQSTFAPLAPTEEETRRLFMRSYARHLLRKHGGQSIKLESVTHDLLMPDGVLSGQDPTDPELYRSELTVVERADQLDQPLLPEDMFQPPAELLPQGGPAQ
ncbi:hypothetical protein KOR34_33130 [Posidoniimonas corsicana]|uniref:Uncharacterized protein n=1 Tax=Posidoniimonas corsicana TaxID=1938618 RepID=A0A5C5V594_9BACT|nr:hypothetical protein [Posidoniimonas corsicana]TWT33481.1 hypothetical protein KOR34_33130 [Posidoniimonas corsicana]